MMKIFSTLIILSFLFNTNSAVSSSPEDLDLIYREPEERGKGLNDIQITGIKSKGELVGFRLENIKKGSILHRLGIRNNDVIFGVDDIKIDSYEKGNSAIDRIYQKKKTKVKLIRNKKGYLLQTDHDVSLKSKKKSASAN